MRFSLPSIVNQFRQHSRKLGGAAEHLIDGSVKRIYRLSCRVGMLLKGAVSNLCFDIVLALVFVIVFVLLLCV